MACLNGKKAAERHAEKRKTGFNKIEKRMNSEHPIDDLFRNELENREPEFREEYWKEAEQKLDQHPQTSSHGTWWKWFGAIIIVAAVAGLMGYYFGMNHAATNSAKQEVSVEQDKMGPDASTASSGNSHSEYAVSDTGMAMSDSLIRESKSSYSSVDSTSSELQKQMSETSSASSSNSLLEKTSDESKSVKRSGVSEDNSSSYPEKTINSPGPSNKVSATAKQNSPKDEKTILNGSDENFGSSSLKSNEVFEKSVRQNSSMPNLTFNETFMEPLTLQNFRISFSSPNPSAISFTPSLSNALKKNQHSPLKSLELSLDGGPTLITVPSIKSTAWGYEWNGLLQYRVNHFVFGTGVGQFSVKDHFTASSEDIIDSSFYIPFATFDTTLVIDSILVDSNFFPHYIYDTTYQINADTSYQLITTHDTITTKKTYTSSGRYLELPIMFSYRFYGWGLRWQLTGGAAYGWYSGGLRYAINSEGQLISYKPGSVISILGRLYAQYPLSRKLYLQGYVGARYVIGLKSDDPPRNYLIYSLGLGLLYQF
jgi:hypothetical protein